jgi:uncharacterized membrane protein
MVKSWLWMGRRKLLRSVDADQVKEAIQKAEKRTSGEIRVVVSSLFWGNVYRAAVRAFERLGMHRTRERNGVLVFVVPSRRRFAVLGDAGIHEKVGQTFWDRVTDVIAEHFRKGDFTFGLVRAIEVIGEELRVHFPFDRASDVNELPDDVDFGKR